MFYKSALLLRDFLRYASAGTSYGPVFDCVCVCLSVCHNRSSIETAEWIELVFGTGAAFHLSYSVLKWNSGIFKNNGTRPGTLSKTPDFKKFPAAYRSSKRVIDSYRRGGRSERDKLDRCRSTKLTIPLWAATLDRCSLSLVIVKLCLQHDSVARVN